LKINPVAVELFCGCGGLSFGMRRAGINVLAGIDIDAKMKETYELNNRGSRFVTSDIRKVTKETILKIFDGHDEPKILAGCAPCIPFSSINQGGGKKHKDYGLLDYFTNLIKEIKPDAVIMENVPGLYSTGREVFSRFFAALQVVGLNSSFVPKLDMADYGVPQHRKRLILIASRGNPKLPRRNHGPGTKKGYVTVRDAIGNLPEITAGYREIIVRRHSCKSLSEVNLKRIHLTPHDGGSRKDLPIDTWIPAHLIHKGHEDTYGRMKWNEPAPTLTCKCMSVSNGRFAHPEQDRGISIREAALIQGFPKTYKLPNNFGVAQKCIGNSFPPLMAENVARALLRSMDQYATGGSKRF
jgi:DNA (cytosine-5)-methyltransferase 1